MILSPAKRERPYGFDMTPMIDVVLQLIIFFLFTSQLSQVIRSPIDLPEEKGDEQQLVAPGGVVIDVSGEGGYLVEGEPRSLEDVVRLVSLEQEHAKAVGQPLDLLVRADKACPAQFVNILAARLAAVGARQWRLGTSVPSGNGGTP
ncbi:MAG: biopolymer transporter ExbD [Phycisphaerales bacterium]|nr:biopolymer transporter ExbD [Phycisphaerales bacterium]